MSTFLAQFVVLFGAIALGLYVLARTVSRWFRQVDAAQIAKEAEWGRDE